LKVSLRKNSKGSGLAEYAILLLLTAALVLVAVISFGQRGSSLFGGSASSLSGANYTMSGAFPQDLQNSQPGIFVYDTRLISGTEIVIPLGAEGGSVEIDWGDGTTTVASLGRLTYDVASADAFDIAQSSYRTATHTYAADGVYTVSMRGYLPHLGATPAGSSLELGAHSAEALIEVISFGDLGLRSLRGAFRGADNLRSVPPLPEDVSDLGYAFAYTSGALPDISGWDVSRVTLFDGMFVYARDFNQDITGWDTSSATTMEHMFRGSDAFDQPIGSWDVSSVQYFSQMFSRTVSFNQNLNNWNVLSGVDFNGMFARAENYNQPMDNWDFGDHDRTHFAMFQLARVFNQDISSWNMRRATNVGSMFNEARAFNSPLNTWDTELWSSTTNMFRRTMTFNQPLNNWRTGNIENFTGMFEDARAFNQDLDTWDTSNGYFFSRMFRGAIVFNGNIDNWNMSRAGNTREMFENAVSFTGDLSAWRLRPMIMLEMFNMAAPVTFDMSGWDFSLAASSAPISSFFETMVNTRTMSPVALASYLDRVAAVSGSRVMSLRVDRNAVAAAGAGAIASLDTIHAAGWAITVEDGKNRLAYSPGMITPS